MQTRDLCNWSEARGDHVAGYPSTTGRAHDPVRNRCFASTTSFGHAPAGSLGSRAPAPPRAPAPAAAGTGRRGSPSACAAGGGPPARPARAGRLLPPPRRASAQRLAADRRPHVDAAPPSK